MHIKGDNHAAVAVIGDGAFTGGLCYEGLNNAGKSNRNIIVILNQNDMSIGKNVGAVAKYLTSIRINDRYLRLKQQVKKRLSSIPIIGAPIAALMLKTKEILKSALYVNSTMFEQFGFVYIGPVNGHNLSELEEALAAAKSIAAGDDKNPSRPVFLHVNTIKGKGYKPSEQNPGAYHSMPPEYADKCPPKIGCDCFSYHIGDELTHLAEKDNRIVAITAAMKYAVGLSCFADRFPERFFDVGIAEAHAVTFAGGLAAAGLLPVFCVYSSFLQRSFDQLIHDLSAANLHAILCIDRAGFVGEDGETHQGLFDIPMLCSVPNVTIFAPSSFSEARAMLKKAVDMPGIVAIRYPKTICADVDSARSKFIPPFEPIRKTNSLLAVGYGRQFSEITAAKKIADFGFDTLKLNQIYPLVLPESIFRYKHIVIFEESQKSGGIGEHLAAKLLETGFSGTLKIVAVSSFVPAGTVSSQLAKFNLDRDGVLRILSEYHAP
jgi:1-deoxy-D-xylulose-5-phosphate synthase